MSKPFETPVKAKYGAPMGRAGGHVDYDAAQVTFSNVPLDSGGYDAGGAYWGLGQTLFCVQDSAGGCVYDRYSSDSACMAALQALYSEKTAITFEPVDSTIYWHLADCPDCGGVSFPSESESSGTCDCGEYIEGDSIYHTESECRKYGE